MAVSNSTALKQEDLNKDLCGDLLEAYAKKPEGVHFVKCETVAHSQKLVQATYHVTANKSQMAEDFFVQNYGMGKLKWYCCGWESGGQMGQFEHPELTKIDAYLGGTITMSGSAEIKDETAPNGVRVETDRSKIEYYVIVVTLSIV